MFGNCGEKYRRRYVLGEKTPPGLAMAKGTSLHAAAEMNDTHRLADPETMLPLDDLRDAAATRFDAELKDGWDKQPDSDPGREKDGAIAMVDMYYESVAPHYRPLLVEQDVVVPIPQTPVTINGRLDLADTMGDVRDLKTSSKTKSQGDADTDLGLTFYALAYRVRTGDWPRGVLIDNYVETASGNRSYKQILTARPKPVVDAFLAKAYMMLAAVGKGVFVPRTGADGNFLCNPRWCGYAKTCRYCDAARA